MMQTTPLLVAVSPIHIYRPKWSSNPWSRFFSIGYFGYFLLRSAWQHEAGWVAVSLALLALGVASVWSGRESLLLVSPDGLTYRVPGGELYIPWHDLYRAEDVPVGFGCTRRGLVPGQAMWRRWGWQTSLHIRRRWRTHIPVWSAGDEYWEPGLMAELAYYAPWLFPPPPPEDGTST